MKPIKNALKLTLSNYFLSGETFEFLQLQFIENIETDSLNSLPFLKDSNETPLFIFKEQNHS